MRPLLRIPRSFLLAPLLGGLLTSCAIGTPEADELAAPAAPARGRQVEVFGAEGSFGTLRDHLPTGQSVVQVPVPDFSVRPGQAFFFPALSSDGTLFIANMTQTYSEIALTGCEMVITCFNPEQATCFDDRSGSPAHFANIRVPAASGSLSTPSECPKGLRSAVPDVYGAEVDDLEVVVDEQRVERVLFDSFDGSREIPAPPNHYPMFGSLWKQQGAWRVDPSSLRYPRDFTDSSRAGPAACPEGDCGAVTEMARLPASQRVVINQYVGEVVMVVDLSGLVLGSYKVESPRDVCDPGATEPMIASLRQVNADPTGVLGDERFIVVYDGWGPTGQVAQEFSYDELEADPAKRVRPITAAFHPNSPFHPAPTCGSGRTALTATYDDLGNLWLTAMDRDGKWRSASLGVVKSQGRRRIESECSFLDPASGRPRPWGTVCETDLDLGALTGSLPKASWSFPDALTDPVVDATTQTMYAVLGSGRVYPIVRKQSGAFGFVWVVGSGLDLSFGRLASREAKAQRRVERGVLDSARRLLWLPVSRSVVYGGLGSAFLVGQELPQHIYRIQLDTAFADDIEVHEVVAPSSIANGADFAVTVRATVAGFNSATSFFALYAAGSAVPLASAAWTRSDCVRDMCRFTTSVPGASIAGKPGVYAWHAGFFAGWRRAHLIGRVLVD